MNVDLLNLTPNEFYAKETYKLEDGRGEWQKGGNGGEKSRGLLHRIG